MKEKMPIQQTKRSRLYQIYQQQKQMSATIPELSEKNYIARNPDEWNKEWKEYLAFLHSDLKPLFRLVHGTKHLREIEACNEIRAGGDRAQSDSVVWNSNTGGGISRTQWVYFSLRLPPYESVSFIGGGNAKIIIDLNKVDNIELFKGMWFGAHISSFEGNGLITTQKIGAVIRRAYYYCEKKDDQKADNQMICLSAKSELETVTRNYLYSDMLFSAEEGLEKFFENIFRFFVEQLQFCANQNAFFQELHELDGPAKLEKTIHLWNLIFQGDTFEICVPGPIPLNLACIQIDEQKNYFKDTALLFTLIGSGCSPNVVNCVKKSLGATHTVDAVKKVLTVKKISPNMRSILKEPALILLVKKMDRYLRCDESNYQILSLFLKNGADIQIRDSSERSLLSYVAVNSNDDYFASLLTNGVEKSPGIIECFNIAMNHTNSICEQFYSSPFFLDTISAFADTTPLIENILPFCIQKENAPFLIQLLSNRTISPTLRNTNSLTPLMMAIQKKLPLGLIELLIVQSKNINAQVTKKNSISQVGWTALHFAIQTSRDNTGEQKKLIEILLENGADITLSDQNGDTPAILLQRLALLNPERYAYIEPDFSDRLATDDQLILQLNHNMGNAAPKSVLISILIQIQETYYVLMIRKPIQWGPIIMARRGLPTHAIGQWWLPGGLIDSNETATQAAAREVFEETGFNIAETDLTEVDSVPSDPDQLSIVISNKIIIRDELPLIFAGSDAAVVSWIPYRKDEWQKIKHNDVLWRKSNWLLVNEHIQFIKNGPDSGQFHSSFFTEFHAQIEYEERKSVSKLREICSPEYVLNPYLPITEDQYRTFKQQIYDWLAFGGAFNQGEGGCQQLILPLITALAKCNDFTFYLELLNYGLDPNIIIFIKTSYFTPITYLWQLTILTRKEIQENQSLTEGKQEVLEQNSANFIRFSLSMYEGINGQYLDFSEYGILSFVCRHNLEDILEQLIPLNVLRNSYAVGCALVSALSLGQFTMVTRLLPLCMVDLNQAYPVQNDLMTQHVYPIQIFFQDFLPPNAPDILQRLIEHGLRTITFNQYISHFKETFEMQKANTSFSMENALLSVITSGNLPQKEADSLLSSYCYYSFSRQPENLERKAKVLKMLETQLAREISMLYIENMPHRFFSSSSHQPVEKQRISDRSEKEEQFKQVAFTS